MSEKPKKIQSSWISVLMDSSMLERWPGISKSWVMNATLSEGAAREPMVRAAGVYEYFSWKISLSSFMRETNIAIRMRAMVSHSHVLQAAPALPATGEG